MRIVIAPDKFKGCLSAQQVAEAIAAGLREVEPRAEIDLCPMADGGEGTVSAMLAAAGGREVVAEVTGPLPAMRVQAKFALLSDGTAVIEMSAASGLALLPPEQRNPLHTTTFGTGELLRAALDAGAKRIILGIGGSATNDCGIGCAQACGVQFVLNDGSVRGPADLPLTGADLLRIEGVKGKGELGAGIAVATDVRNPLFGPDGAAAVYSPQKGASPQAVGDLDAAARRLTRLLSAEAEAHTPGAGAAGGLGFGMLAFVGAQLKSGIDLVMEATHLRERLRGAALCITGEGRFDSQSLAGKTPAGVARLCHELKVPCVVLAGSVPADIGQLPPGVTAFFSITGEPMTLEEAMAQAAARLRLSAANVLRVFRVGRGSI